jgi:hypothetical protein
MQAPKVILNIAMERSDGFGIPEVNLVGGRTTPGVADFTDQFIGCVSISVVGHSDLGTGSGEHARDCLPYASGSTGDRRRPGGITLGAGRSPSRSRHVHTSTRFNLTCAQSRSEPIFASDSAPLEAATFPILIVLSVAPTS